MQFRMKDFHQKNKLNMRPFVIGSLHEAEVQNYQQAHANHNSEGKNRRFSEFHCCKLQFYVLYLNVQFSH